MQKIKNKAYAISTNVATFNHIISEMESAKVYIGCYRELDIALYYYL